MREFPLLLAAGLLMRAPTTEAHPQTLRDLVLKVMKERNQAFRGRGRRACEQAMIYGTVVQRLSASAYEVEYPLPPALYGMGDRDEGGAITVLLRTRGTEFQESGDFELCVKGRLGRERVTRSDGFKSYVLVAYEDPRGFFTAPSVSIYR